MPDATNVHTASKIKVKISGSAKFVLLATPNALDSRWVPWELGIAHGLKGRAHMAILPVVGYTGKWQGNEYVGMYPTIYETSGGWAVFQPDQSTVGTPLAIWLAR